MGGSVGGCTYPVIVGGDVGLEVMGVGAAQSQVTALDQLHTPNVSSNRVPGAQLKVAKDAPATHCMKPTQSNVAKFPVAPTGQTAPQEGTMMGEWVGEDVGGVVGFGVFVGTMEKDGMMDGDMDVLGASDFVGLIVGTASNNTMGSLIRSTAHHMTPLMHWAKAY